jgi:hypothetical protein
MFSLRITARVFPKGQPPQAEQASEILNKLSFRGMFFAEKSLILFWL